MPATTNYSEEQLFDTDAEGKPVNIVIAEAESEDVFNSSSKKALSQWEFAEKNKKDAIVVIEFKLE